MARPGKLAIRRIHAPLAAEDGVRILVDRLWPRGLSLADAAIDAWLKEVAPSAALRKWFGHEPAKWAEFRHRYFAELDDRPDAVAALREHLGKGRTTLLYAARDEAHNNPVALRDYLVDRA